MKITMIVTIFIILTGSLFSGTIQDKINAANPGDIILIPPGTYVENINFHGKSITLKSMSGPQDTIIDGKMLGPVVTFESGEVHDSVLCGFTITNGSGKSWPNLPLEVRAGGGVFCYGSSPIIKNNWIMDNSTVFGGGIFCDYSSPAISNNKIINNHTKDSGAGIYCMNMCEPVMINNIIAKNNADHGGGGVGLNSFSHAILTNNTITLNTGKVDCGGFGCSQSNPIVTNTIIWGNQAPVDPNMHIPNSNPIINYCNIGGGWPGINNISSDPLFLDTANNDFRISHSSLCIDNGDNFALNIPTKDYSGEKRIINGNINNHQIVDIGADEFWLLSVSELEHNFGSGFDNKFYFTNPFNVPITVDTVTVTGANSTEFIIIHDELSGAILKAGETRMVVVVFNPLSDGPKEAILTVAIIKPFIQTIQILLTGSSSPASIGHGGGGGGSRCFIATAAYGSYLDPNVVFLRNFIDKWLLTNKPGRWLVQKYYKYSPELADKIRERPMLKTLTVFGLTPIVYSIKYSNCLIILIFFALLTLKYKRLKLTSFYNM